jgi:hypothetical protein
MKWFLTISSIVAFIAAMTLELFYGNKGFLLAGMVAFVALLIAANLDRIVQVKASKDGFEVHARAVVERAEIAVSELQLLAKALAELSLSLVIRQGRIGGYSDDEQNQIKASVLGVLGKLGVAQTEIDSTMEEWHRVVEFDYAHHILGGSRIPNVKDPELHKEWRALRQGGFSATASPDAVRSFLLKFGLLTSAREELLEDYEHYRETKVHRRPDIWLDRQNWGHLQ